MNKIFLIIKREYVVRVKKKSFIIMTILAPLLMAALIVAPVFLADQGQEKRLIAVTEIESSYAKEITDSENIHFTIIAKKEADLIKNNISESPYYAILDIQDTNFTLYGSQQIGLNVRKSIENQIETIIERNNLKRAGIDIDILEKAKTNITIKTKIIDNEGKTTASNAEASIGIGFITGILIYMFIFMYGTMVMRGVIEEKTNRIVEIIISSVKPFQLMMGKILGVALVGLTQFFLWILLTVAISAIAELLFIDTTELANDVNSIDQSVILAEFSKLTGGIDLVKIFISFIFFFLFGYLMYSSLFAAVGSAVDAEADTQQFVVPITIPLILAFILIQPVMDNPDGPLAFWLSIIPLTSPVIMMARLPFGVENWELILSMILLICGFILTTSLAAKIYRTGILMYGKKISYKELWKWLSYKG
ncbi:MAG: ABC transporter permease [Flavobacteriales bacterium]|jgi:ABC-2 type transport system permease protein|tara:strand:+ start:1 stop:1266 length:1266 start_codon:yes stop_codon:yes gene_type:complete